MQKRDRTTEREHGRISESPGPTRAQCSNRSMVWSLSGEWINAHLVPQMLSRLQNQAFQNVICIKLLSCSTNIPWLPLEDKRECLGANFAADKCFILFNLTETWSKCFLLALAIRLRIDYDAYCQAHGTYGDSSADPRGRPWRS